MAAWLPAARLAERRAAAAGPLAPLARSLAADLAPVLDRELVIPTEKARLSRAGGRCPRDGAMLAFDPYSPRRHRCPTCGGEFDDEAHYRYWIVGYHLWLAERAVHAAALHALGGDARHASFAADVLDRYADAYARWPNVDNVLGPTRPFFSTYLESIWLLQLCVALDLLEGVVGRGALGGRVRDMLVSPSVALIAGYDEGESNRQVWNNAALLAGAHLVGDAALAERCVWGPSGVTGHLSGALLSDGTWYEGENYHLFAHRGLWYGVHLAEAVGQGPLDPEGIRRFDEGFAAPFATALPDLTFPARRDSQYAVSLRQWRFAELAELGLARHPDDRRLHTALARLYDGAVPRGDTGRARSTAEAERNEPASALGRADLGWRSLLFARPELPPARVTAPGSVLLPAQGLAVLRRDAGRAYAALDYGVSGGGHGHPDRLNLLLAVGDERWLDDPGTGSYVDPSLHWYRSTLAHAAPLVDGRSQPQADGELLAYEERGGAGWVDATVAFDDPPIVLRRTVVVMPDYLVDELRWDEPEDVTVELPVHAPGSLVGPEAWGPADPPFERGEFLRDVARAAAPSVRARLEREDGRTVAWFEGERPVEWWRAVAPGAPGRSPHAMHLARMSGAHGSLRTVWSWRGAVADVAVGADGALQVRLADGACHAHARAAHGWHVALSAGGASSSIDLGGRREAASPLPARRMQEAHVAPMPDASRPLRAELGEAEYRRSEATWAEAGAPRAAVELHVAGDADGALHVRLEVGKRELHFVPPGAVNDMDNERADVNGDGVQLHLATRPTPSSTAEPAAWLLVPQGERVRVVPLDARAEAVPLRAWWTATPGGYRLQAVVPLAPFATPAGAPPALLGVGLLVNDGAPGRERRRGQLVLGGARGEFVYLRGDRHEAARFLWFRLSDA